MHSTYPGNLQCFKWTANELSDTTNKKEEEQEV